MSLLDRHSKLTMQGAVGVVWVPIDADVLFNFTKTSTIKYTKSGGGVTNAYFYRNHAVALGKRVRMQNAVWSNEFCGFFNPALGDADEWKNFDYGLQAFAGTSILQAIERSVVKFTSAGGFITGNEVLEVERTGTALYKADGITQYNSVQNFNTGFYGGLTIAVDGNFVDNVEIVI